MNISFLCVARLAVLLSIVLLVACNQHSIEIKPVANAKDAAATTMIVTAPNPLALADESKNIATLLSSGDYVGAIAAIEKSAASEPEKLSATGRLMLDGAVDPNAKTRPNASIDDGLSRLERAAKLGHEPSVSDLVGVFTVGVNYRGERVLLPPVAELANCWQAVQKQSKTIGDCIALRKQLGIPKV
jgi:hypothetical protein